MVKGTTMQDQDEKHAQIQLNAYFRSLRRDYNDPLLDWFEAEADVLTTYQDAIADESYLGPARSEEHARSGITGSDGKDHENPA
jgi:hypothetical protein